MWPASPSAKLATAEAIVIPEDKTKEKYWYALHTRSRHEKKVARLLDESKVEHFLPLRRVLSQWADRKKWVEKPYFPGYLFVRIHLEQAPLVSSRRGVVGLVSSRPGIPAIIPESEIDSVFRLVESQVHVDPYPYLKPGQIVYVRRGPLRGVEGTLIRKNKKHFLVVSVPLLGQSVIAEVPADSVQGL